MTGLVVFAHGSRLEAANETVRDAARRLRESLGADQPVETAFLELGEPSLPDAIDRLLQKGASRIVVIPYFLTMGRHVERDLPRMVNDIAAARPGVTIEVTPPLDGHPALLDILRDRVREALV